MKISRSNENAVLNYAVAVSLMLCATLASAGAGGTEFTQIYDQLSGWVNGTLGKTIGVASLLVGLGIGVIKQSVMAAVVGVSISLVAGFGPDVIDGVITAAAPITESI